MDTAVGLIGLWLLGLAAAVARRSWVWFAVASVVGLTAALVQGGAVALVTGVHEDSPTRWGFAPALGWWALGSALAAALIAWRSR